MVAAPFHIALPSEPEPFASEIARRLSYARFDEGGATIITPVLYPSGRAVSVRLLGGPKSYVVTDDGATMSEAELIGASDLCREEARKVADRYQLRFNQWEIFEVEAAADRLPAFISIVANAAAESMLRTTDALTRRLERIKRESLADKIERIFGNRQVVKHPTVHGSSTKEWLFEAQVTSSNGRMTLFTLVTPAPASVTWAYAKMDDVSRLDQAPMLAAVTDGRLAADDKVLIGRAARKVLALGDADDTFRLAA